MMKDYKAIMKDYKKVLSLIEKDRKELDILFYSQEKKDAVRNNDGALYKVLKEKAVENRDAIDRLNKRITENQVLAKVLYDNVRASFTSAFIDLFKEEIQKYKGKQYGKATKDKIYNFFAEKGFSVLFSNYGYCGDVKANYITVNVVVPREYDNGTFYHQCDYNAKVDCYVVTADNRNGWIIDDNNTIVCDFSEIRFSIKYAEDPRKRAKEIIKAFNAYKDAADRLKAIQGNFESLLPSTIKRPDHLIDYYMNLL